MLFSTARIVERVVIFLILNNHIEWLRFQGVEITPDLLTGRRPNKLITQRLYSFS